MPRVQVCHVKQRNEGLNQKTTRHDRVWNEHFQP